MALKVWKFLIPGDRWVEDPENPARSYRGCLAVAMAETLPEARAAAVRYAAENGFDTGWLRAASVVEIPLVDGAVLAWALV